MVNPAKLQQAMTDSISEVLETMFFTPVDDLKPAQDAAEECAAGSRIVVRLAFGGAFGGSFRLCVPECVAAAISADFLGVAHAALSSADMVGTVKEMVNMLAGNTLSLYDYREIFNLQLPEVEPVNERIDIAPPGYQHLGLVVDVLQQRMRFELTIKI